MFSDYKAGVIRYYHQKREEGSISLNLQHPTPAKLKQECLIVFEIRRTKADLEILRQYFGHKEDETDYERAIRTMETDRFKPLVKLLRKEIKNTEDKNIQLLSWLIDFNPRPYRFGVDVTKSVIDVDRTEENSYAEINDLNQNEKKTIEGGSRISHQTDSKLDPLKIGLKADWPKTHWYQNKGFKGIILLGIALIGFASVISLNKNLKLNSFYVFSGNENQCMYWAVDHFVSVECFQKIPNIDVVALDTFKLKQFKKITRPDTLTLADINKVWYSKIDKIVELYTAPGHHPEHPEKQLKSLSKYMFSKYVLKNRDSIR